MTTQKVKAALKNFGLPRLIIAGFLLLLLIMAPFVGADLPTQISNIINRFSWNGILVLAMVPMVHSGCGLNFGLPLGIISGLLGATLSIEFGFTGPLSFLAAILIATPFALILGTLYGWLLNKIKGGEMMIATYVGFSSVSFMCMMWLILPYHSPNMVWGLSGKGLRTTISLEGYYIGALANFLQINIGSISIPTGTLLFFALLAFCIWAFLHTKTGTAMTAVGSNPAFAKAAGINVDKIRMLSVIMSTWLAAIGILVYEQGFGFIQLYMAPFYMALPAVSAILIGGASVNKATIMNVIVGTILFQGIVTMTPTVMNNMIHMDMSEVIRIIADGGVQMKKGNNSKNSTDIRLLVQKFSVPLMFIIICAICIPLSGLSANMLINEIVTRIGRNAFLILSLLIPIMAGMGLNFGMTLGAMAAEIALIFVSDWQIVGIPGMVLAAIVSVPISVLLGIFCGKILNEAKGREMITSYIMSFFVNGIYQLVVLYLMGSIIPIKHGAIKLPRGYGIRNTVSLLSMRQKLDNLLAINVAGVKIPVLTFIIIALLCLFIVWFSKTKLGQDMRAVGQDMGVARDAGINVERTRIISIVMSTVLAGFGMIIYLQNMGNIATYSAHSQIGMFCIAALLVGGASVDRASIGNVFLGVILFHTMFIVAPKAGAAITGDSMIGEYFRVFVSYAVITIALVMYETNKRRAKSAAGQQLQAAQDAEEAAGKEKA